VQAQEYEVEGVRSANLEINVRGNRYPDQILLIGAHYDSVYGSPGANDNASGVAALLELSRLFKSASPSRSLRFVAFVNEEPPFFLSRQQGSMRYAHEARRRGDDIRLMLALDHWVLSRRARESALPALIPPLLSRSRKFHRLCFQPQIPPAVASTRGGVSCVQ
jgi:Iap family predicted aminopeptidase